MNNWFNNLPVKQKRSLLFFILIFLISAGLRSGMVRFNRQSNDDHMTVINLILKTNQLPQSSDCHECYSPKLYHYSAALFLRLTGMENLNNRGQIFGAELINFIAGLITIFIIGVFLFLLPGNYEILKILAFGLVALNPDLIGINSMVTNDSFVILFSTLALFCTYFYLQKPRLTTFIFIVLFTILAISSKTNGWITAVAIFISLLIKSWMINEHRWKSFYIPFTFLSVTIVFSFLNPLNQYAFNLHNYGSPILLNRSAQPLPHFFIQTPNPNAGILSIEDGLFTFKFYDLLVHPRIENDSINYPPHRTSLWTQLYGRGYSIQFANYPGAWRTFGEDGFPLSRAIFSLALIPTILLLVGATMEIFLTIKAFFNRDVILASDTNYGLTAVTFVGFMAFIILYSLELQRYQSMKPIFIYPAIITFPLLFLRAGDAVFNKILPRFNWIKVCMAVMITVLLFLFCADVFTMIHLIYSNTFA